MIDDISDRRKRSKWDDHKTISNRFDRERNSGDSRWDERRSRSPGTSRQRSRSRSPPPRLSDMYPDTKKAVDPAAAAGLKL